MIRSIEAFAPKENPIFAPEDRGATIPTPNLIPYQGDAPGFGGNWKTVPTGATIPQETPIHSTIPEGITPKLSPVYMGAGTSVSSPTGGAPSASLPAWVVPVGLLALAYWYFSTEE
jgi:hypothetical protein